MKTNFDRGASVNLISRSNDPFDAPLARAKVTLTLWTNDGTRTGSWLGVTNAEGWFNASDVTLPSAGGAYELQATVNSTYVGIFSFQFFVGPLPLNVVLVFSEVAIAAGAVVGAFFLMRRRLLQKSRPGSL